MNQIVIKEKDWKALRASLYQRRDIESGAYALFALSTSNSGCKLLVRRLLLPEDHDYLKRTPVCVAFKPSFTETALSLCEDTGLHLLDIHTHPWSEDVAFSSIDDREAKQTKIPYLHQYLPGTNVAFVVFGGNCERVQARMWDKDASDLDPLDRLVIV
jgi:hypothetical protein